MGLAYFQTKPHGRQALHTSPDRLKQKVEETTISTAQEHPGTVDVGGHLSTTAVRSC